MAFKIAVPKETADGEKRVALVPSVVEKFVKLGAEVTIQKGAGNHVLISDAAYKEAGAKIGTSAAKLYKESDLILRIQAPAAKDIANIGEGQVLASLVYPQRNPDLVKKLRDGKVSAFAMELVPRITRAQSMDVLSSQASVTGYHAALIAARRLARFMPMLTTAAGTIRPAKVLVIGAGVAGLQAIATSRRLGAMVEAYDVRTASKEQVESLGAKFVMSDIKADASGGYARELTEDEKQAQADMLAKHVAKSDAIICTASLPGRPSPKIITKAMVEGMKPGAVLVDLAAEGGGNCELTEPGKDVRIGDVTICGPLNMASMGAEHASEMFAKNFLNFFEPFMKEGEFDLNWEDEVIANTLLTKDGEIVHEPSREIVG